MKKLGVIFVIFMFLTLTACGDLVDKYASTDSSSETTTTTADNQTTTTADNQTTTTTANNQTTTTDSTQSTNDQGGEDGTETIINTFYNDIINAEEYSYEFVIIERDKQTNETFETYFIFAKSGTSYGFYLSGTDDDPFRYVVTDMKLYIITESDKTVVIMTIDNDQYDLFLPDMWYLNNFDEDYYDFKTKTENVMINNISTTCYEYEYLGMSVKYYVDSNEYIIKIEYEDDSDYSSFEFKEIKTSNIDTTILTVPTEADGYEILDLSSFE